MANAVHNAQTAETAPVAAQGGGSQQQAISAPAGAANDYVEALESALFNCCKNNEAPDWERFDAIEVGGCRNDAEEGAEDTCICGGYMADEAEFFTIYGHLIEGGVEAITDVPTLAEAQIIANLFASQNGFEIHFTC